MGKNNLGFGIIVILILIASAGLVIGIEDENRDVFLDVIDNVINGKFIDEINDGLDNEGKIEDGIYDKFDENETVLVLIELRGDVFDDDLEEIKRKVKENQEIVLEELGIEFEIIYRYEVLNGFAGEVTEEGMKILEESENVIGVYLNKNLNLNLQESVGLINADDTWEVVTVNTGNLTGQGKTVCVVDSGIDYNHPDLGGGIGNGFKVKGGVDFIDLDQDPMDEIGHGTHVAGIVAASGNSVGVAPDAKLIAVRVCDDPLFGPVNCPSVAMVAGIDYCVANKFSLGTDVITMSLGNGGEYGPNSGVCPMDMNFASSFANYMDIPITISSGNDNHKNGISWPACDPNVISVGAVYDDNLGPMSWSTCSDSSTQTDKVSCFTNSGSNLDLLAPGSVITSTTGTQGTSCGAGSLGTGDCSGTSMAAPHVAGTIALIKQLSPGLTPSEIEFNLKNNGIGLVDTGNGMVFPRIDALASVNSIINVPWSPDNQLTGIVGSKSVVDSQDNVHIIGRTGNELRYTKLDNNGNRIIENLVISSGSAVPIGEPEIEIDLLDEIHVVWFDARLSGNQEIYYMKLDDIGNIVLNEMLVRNNVNSKNKFDMDVDDFRNVHIVWDEFLTNRWRIPYTKIDNGGNIVVNAAIKDNPNTLINGNAQYIYSRNPSIVIDSNNDVIITYEFYIGSYYNSSGPNDLSNWYRLYYKKLNNNGNVLVNDIVLKYHYWFNTFYVESYNNLWNVKLDADNQGNVVLQRKFGLNVWFLTNSNGHQYGLFSLNTNNTIMKLNNNGGILWSRNYMHDTPNYDLNVDGQGDVHAVFQNTDNFPQDEIYYSKFDSNGNVLINEQRLTYGQSPSTNSINPDLSSDSNGEMHLIFKKQGPLNYKRTLSNINMDIPTVSIGNTIPVQIYDGLNPGKNYIVALSYGNNPGFTLPDGRIIGLNLDNLMISSLQPGFPLGSNLQGTLDNNGRATVYFTIPNNPSFIGQSVYIGFVTMDSSGVLRISPSFPVIVSS